jgi:hypothetical protein
MTAVNSPAEDPRIVEPEYHAGRLHALVVSLVCIDDTPHNSRTLKRTTSVTG